MRYSEILGAAFYKIGLSEPVSDMIDVHYTASAHHYWRLKDEAAAEIKRFHLVRHRAHLKAMMLLIYEHGVFTWANDESFRNLDCKESWHPSNGYMLPDPNMFNSMSPDPSCKINEDHPSDAYLFKEHFIGCTDH